MKKSARKTTRKATGRTKKAPASAASLKAVAKKAASKKPVAKKAVAKKPAAKKAVAKKAIAKKSSGKRAAKGAVVRPEMLGEVEALAALMDTHGLLDVAYEIDADGSKRIHVSRSGGMGAPQQVFAAPAAASAPVAAAAAPAADVPSAAPAAEEGLVPFASPMVGTFYRAPSPEAAPFTSVGDVVTPDTPVCIIEAMKVMNEINPDVGGEVVSFEVENGQAVEFGQTLMLLRPR